MRFILIFLMIFTGCLSSLSAQTATSRIAAVVDKRVITEADLMNRLKFAALSSGLQPSAENLEQIKPQMLHTMIDEQLQLGIGDKYGLKIGEEQIKEAIKDVERGNGMPEGTIAAMMKEKGIPLKTFEDQIRAQLTWVLYLRTKYPLKSVEENLSARVEQDFGPSLQIAEWEIEQEMKALREKDRKIQYHLAEIVLPFDTAEQEARVKSTLDKLSRELQKGAHFTALAQQFSQSPTAAQGGDMGWLTEEQIDPEVKEALDHLQPGQLSMPIRTAQGYTIIAFIERRLPIKEGEVLISLQNVLLPFPGELTEEMAESMIEQAKGISRKGKSCPALESAAKKVYANAQANMIQDVTMETLPEPLQEVVKPLSVNQVTQPLLSQDGVVLIMLCNKRTAKIEEVKREDAEQNLANRKYGMIARRELRDLRRHAFINVRM